MTELSSASDVGLGRLGVGAEMVTMPESGRQSIVSEIGASALRFVKILRGKYTVEDECEAVNAQMRKFGPESFSYVRSAESAPPNITD